MLPKYLTDNESLADLESRMLESDKAEYQSFKSLRSISAFINRIFIIYTPTGLTFDKQHRQPKICGQVRLTDYAVSPKTGISIELEDIETGRVHKFGHIPERLFDYPIFMSSAPIQKLRWDARRVDDVVIRSLRFAVLSKQRTKLENYSAGATMIATPGEYAELYPQYPVTLRAI